MSGISFRNKGWLIGAACALMAFASVAEAAVNRSVTIPDGTTSGGESSVNGSITVGDNATITGRLNTVNGKIRVGRGSTVEDAETVNGRISLDDDTRAEDIETVNGSIEVGENAEISGNVAAVNGSVTLGRGSTIAKDIGNVNGDITLIASIAGRNVSTVSGDVELSDGAVIRGDLVIRKPKGFSWGGRETPKIVIGPGCRVEGTIRLEREAELYISETAEVGGVEGEMSMDDAVRFSGKRP